MIWMVKDGELVTETDEMTDSMRTDVLTQFTIAAVSSATMGSQKVTYQESLR